MTVRKRNEWAIERAHYERIFFSRTRKRTKIHSIVENNEVGYTVESGDIYLAEEHMIMDGMTKPEKKFFRMGVFAHEMLHQIFSDFRILKIMQKKLRPGEYKVYHSFMNILEDSYIEWRAPVAIGGKVLKALRFMISHVWKWSKPLSDSKSPFGQLMSALIQLGDLGKVKGDFTFPEAEECYIQIAPIFHKGVKELSVDKRNEYALQMMEIARPLWEMEANLEEMLRELLSKMGKAENPKSSKAPLDDSDAVPTDPSEIDKIREETIRKMEKAAEEKGVSASDKTDMSGKSDGEKAKGAASSDTETGETSDSGHSSDSKPDSTSQPAKDSDSEKSESEDESEIPDCTIDKTDEDWLKDAESRIEEELEKEEEESKEFEIDPDIEPSIYADKKYRIENTTPEYSDLRFYQCTVADNMPAIIGLKSKLLRIFRNDATRKEHRKTGKVNVKRLYGSRQTSRVFDRKTSPKDLDDLAVFIAVDESYSMVNLLKGSIQRSTLARKLAVCLTEVFSSLKIPIYVMGFTADKNRYHANHHHYVKWKATEREKGKLVNIEPIAENFDSLSLSYASEILKKRKAKHKLLIVLSDGLPLCHSVSMEQGFRDLKEVVQNTKKQGMSVLGVAIGNDSTEQIQYLYGNHFIHAQNVENAFLDISTEISKIVKTW